MCLSTVTRHYVYACEHNMCVHAHMVYELHINKLALAALLCLSVYVFVETAGKKERTSARARERERERDRKRRREGRRARGGRGMERENGSCLILRSPLEMLDLCSSTPHTQGELIAAAFVIL
jgi:hypothetical protein